MDAKSPLENRAHFVAAAIIAGGNGTRLGGVPKGLLRVTQETIIETQLRLLRSLFSRVFVVSNDSSSYAHLGVPVLPDRLGAGSGPLAGIETALTALLAHECAVVCVAVDMPFLCAPVLSLLRDEAPDEPALVPWVGGFPEPLCARYGRQVLPRLTQLLSDGQRKMTAALQAIGAAKLAPSAWQAVDPHERFATNINTPESLAEARAMALRQRPSV